MQYLWIHLYPQTSQPTQQYFNARRWYIEVESLNIQSSSDMHDHTKHNGHLRPTHDHPNTDWTYSRSRSGLRKHTLKFHQLTK